MTDFKVKMHQIRFRLGLSSTPDRAAGSLQRSPYLPAGFGGRFAAGVEGLGWGRGGEGEEGGSGGEGKGGPPSYC